MARTRLHRLAILVAVWAAAGLAAAQPAAAATPVHVKVRVEGPAHTVTQSRQVGNLRARAGVQDDRVPGGDRAD